MLKIITILSLISIAFSAYNDHCHGLDCPIYNVTRLLESDNEVEIRSYPRLKWVSTNVSVSSIE